MVGSGGSYFVAYGLSLKQKKSVALAIFMEVSDNFEEMQARWPFSWGTNSGNSEEDRPSNLIGFYRALNGLTKEACEGMCMIRTKKESKCLWDKIGGLKKSKSWTPTDYNFELREVTNDKNIAPMQWPFNTISPAVKGAGWRDWNSGDYNGVIETFNGP